MKNLSLFKILFMALAIFAVSSCSEDDPTVLTPTVFFVDGVDLISGDADVDAGATFRVSISAGKGDSPLSSLRITEDGATIDASRIVFAHTTPANNPQLVVDGDVEGFTWDITITAHADEREAAYEFSVTDADGNQGSNFININTVIATVFEASITAGSGCFSVDAVVDSPTNFCLNINATRGADLLSSVTIYENNDEIDISRLDWAENPLVLDASQGSAFSDLVVSIDSHNSGTSEYRAVITDAGGATTEASIFVTVGTVVEELTGVLLNAAGPSGTGGLNLNTGVGTGSANPDSHIRDQGINSGPLPDNWIQKISGINGFEIRFANNLPDGFKFDNIAIKEEIIGAFDSSDDIANLTDVVATDDQFVISDGTDYFFIKITSVNKTDNNNEDNYVMSIKK